MTEDLLDSVPRSLRPDTLQANPVANALSPWIKAAACLSPDVAALLKEAYFGVFDRNMKPLAPLPGNVRRNVEATIDAGRDAIAFIEDGISTGSFMLPFADSPGARRESTYWRPMLSLKDLAELKYLKARTLIEDARFAAALAEAIQLCEMGRMMGAGGGGSALYIDGCLVRLYASRILNELAYGDGVPNAVMRDEYAFVDSIHPSRGCFLRSFFGDILHAVARAVRQLDSDMGVEDMVNATFGDAFLAEELAGPGDAHEEPGYDGVSSCLAAVRPGLAFVMQGHPRPFDKGETTRLLAREFRFVADWFDTPPLGSIGELGASQHPQDAIWPESFRVGAAATADEAITGEDLVALRRKVTSTANPFGRLLVAEVGRALRKRLQDSSFWWYHMAVCHEALHTVLALRLYAARYGGPAKSLDDLVSEGVMGRAPTDQVSGRPLIYSLAEQAILSNGAEAVPEWWASDMTRDSHGRLLWRIPGSNGTK